MIRHRTEYMREWRKKQPKGYAHKYYLIQKRKINGKCETCGKGIHLGASRFCSRACFGISMQGHKKGFEIGEKNPNWKGGVTELTYRLRYSTRGIDWRKKVFAKDNFTCQNCGIRGTKLQADHIKPVFLNPELIFDLNNGRTLCISCHRKTDTFGLNAIKFRKMGVLM